MGLNMLHVPIGALDAGDGHNFIALHICCFELGFGDSLHAGDVPPGGGEAFIHDGGFGFNKAFGHDLLGVPAGGIIAGRNGGAGGSAA